MHTILNILAAVVAVVVALIIAYQVFLDSNND